MSESQKKTINGVVYTFKLIDGILVETVESFLLRGGVIQRFTMKGELLDDETTIFEPEYWEAA